MNSNNPRPSARIYLDEIHEMILDFWGLPTLHEKNPDFSWEILWFSHYSHYNCKKE